MVNPSYETKSIITLTYYYEKHSIKGIKSGKKYPRKLTTLIKSHVVQMYTLRKTFKFGSLEGIRLKCTLEISTHSRIRVVWSNAFKCIFTSVKVTKSIQQGNVEGKSQVRLRQKTQNTQQ